MTIPSGDLTGRESAALIWRRARRCDAGHCVEIADQGDWVFVRDSKDPAVVLTFGRQEWAAFLDGVLTSGFVEVTR